MSFRDGRSKKIRDPERRALGSHVGNVQFGVIFFTKCEIFRKETMSVYITCYTEITLR